jgi:hypothetical protein
MRDVRCGSHRSNNSILSAAKVLFTDLKINSVSLAPVSKCGKDIGMTRSPIKAGVLAAEVRKE